MDGLTRLSSASNRSNPSNFWKWSICAVLVGALAAGALAEGGLLEGIVREIIDKIVQPLVEPPADDEMAEPDEDEDAMAATEPATQPGGSDASENASDQSGEDDAAPATQPAWPVMALKPALTLGDPSFRHDGTITHMEVLADMARLLTTGNDGTARLWDLRTGQELMRYAHKGEYVWDSAVLNDQERMLTTGDENKIVMWELKTGKRLREFKHYGMVFRVAVDSQSRRAAGGDASGLVILWDLRDGDKLASFPGRKSSSAYTVAFDKDEAGLIAGWSDSIISTWTIATKEARNFKEKDKPVKTRRGAAAPPDTNATGSIFTIATSPDKAQAVVCCGGRSPWLMDMATGKEIWRAKDAPSVHCAAWSPDGTSIAVVEENHIWALSATDGSKRWSVELGGGTSYGVSYHPDGKSIFCGTEQLVCRLDASDGKRIYPAPDAPWQNSPVHSAIPMPGSDLVLECGGGKGIRLWDRKTGLVREVWAGESEIKALALSPDGKRLLAAADKTMMLLDTQTGKPIRQWQTEEGYRKSIVISADGKWALSGAAYNDVVVYNLDTGEVQSRISAQDRDNGEYNPIRASALSPNMRVATCQERGGVRILSALKGDLVQSLDSESKFTGCGFMGDAGGLITWGAKELVLWSVTVEKGRPLTEDQARQLIAQLGSDEYAKREEASKRLAAAGNDILPLIKSVKGADMETRQRLAAIQEQITKGVQFKRAQTLSLPKGEEGELAAHPDGKHWVLVRGANANRHVILGQADQGRLKIICSLELPHMPSTIQFDSAGNLIAGNRNGTVCVYENILKPEQQGIEALRH